MKSLSLLTVALFFATSLLIAQPNDGQGQGQGWGRGQGGPGMGQGQGQGQGWGRGQGRQKRRGGGIFANLKLTDEQKKKLKELRASKKADKQKGKMKELRQKLAELMTSKSFNESAAKKIAGEIGDHMKSNMIRKIEFVSKIRAILTKEQLDKVNFAMLWRGKGRGRGRHRGRGMNQGYGQGQGNYNQGYGRGRGRGQGRGMGQGQGQGEADFGF